MKRDACSPGRAILAVLWIIYQFRLDICVYAFQPSMHMQMMWSRTQNVARSVFNSPIVSQMATPIRNATGDTNSDGKAGTNIFNDKESNPTNIERTERRTLPSNWLGEKIYILFTAALIGLTTGTNIAIFKKAVEGVREILYGDGMSMPPSIEELFGTLGSVDGGGHYFFSLSEKIPLALAPAVGGLLVGILLRAGGDLPPGLRDTVTEGKLISQYVSNLIISQNSLMFLFHV